MVLGSWEVLVFELSLPAAGCLRGTQARLNLVQCSGLNAVSRDKRESNLSAKDDISGFPNRWYRQRI